MNSVFSRGLAATRRFLGAALRAARNVRAALAEVNHQQARLARQRLSQDAYMINPNAAPDTYAEFLFRTKGPLRHEPSWRARLDGHPVH
jgi:hypothetical protein